jgi:cullin-4
LQSLACAKVRPLSKVPVSKDIKKGDTFTVNANFSSPRYRVKINRIQQKETKKETKETHERVALDREFETQAAIVRIMKGKKEYPHVNLMADVINATKKRGTMTPAEIKKQIDRYVETSYLMIG